MIPDTLGKYKFDFLSGVRNAPIKLITTGCERIKSPSYHLDSRQREDCYLFQYTLSGSGTLKVGDEKYTVDKGKGFLIHMPQENEYYFDEKSSEEWHFVYVRFKGDACASYCNHIMESFGNVLSLGENESGILSLFEIYRRASTGRIADSFTAERLVFDFLCRLCSNCMTEPETLSEIVKTAKQLVEKDFAVIDGIFELSQKVGVSQNHLSRTFSKEVKMSVQEYLTRTRLQNAVNLLAETEKTTDEISNLCGFSCGNYFCKVFRKYMGTSPMEYRKRIKNASYSGIMI